MEFLYDIDLDYKNTRRANTKRYMIITSHNRGRNLSQMAIFRL